MAKIPQGEWHAIAARYSKGESLSSIARHYGCTPPAIHYILKRVKGLGSGAAETPVPVQPQPAAEIRVERRSENVRTGEPASATAAKVGLQSFPMRQHRLEKGESRPLAGARPAVAANGQRPPVAAPKPLGAARAPALTAELDAALQAHVEAAIQSFRSSFTAALAESSPASRERLRQAAAGLMRAAARTTIVLDRVNAGGKSRPVETD
jgi:transposase-like protein